MSDLYCVGIATQGVEESKVVVAPNPSTAARTAFPDAAPGTKLVVWMIGRHPTAFVVGTAGQLHDAARGLD